MMEIRFAASPNEVKNMDTETLRANFLMSGLMQADILTLTYSHYDRVITGGVKPVGQKVALPNEPELRADYFLQRRELGIINLGGTGVVVADGVAYELDKLDALYLGKGTQAVTFESKAPDAPALFFLMSTTAHLTYPNTKMSKEQAAPVKLGAVATANQRTIYKYIHADGIASCQLVMGLTLLDEGSVWNSVPPHTHTRRTEVYFYFDLNEEQRVFHFMGQPEQTRHLVVANNEAIVSPPWSVHFGSGTGSYGFIWAMAGENQAFTDMDALTLAQLK
jgi:4-deoxy-L-threo-5-hexosulose-uronate ketol-isomerase